MKGSERMSLDTTGDRKLINRVLSRVNAVSSLLILLSKLGFRKQTRAASFNRAGFHYRMAVKLNAKESLFS